MPISSSQLDQMQRRLKGEKVHVGRTNSINTGKSFEAAIQESLYEYERQGVMWGRKVDPPVKIAGKQVIFLANSFLDFCGVYTSQNGRAMHFEAKSTTGRRPRLPLARNGGITLKQMATIRTLVKARAIVFVLWRVENPKPMKTLIISGERLMYLQETGKLSVTEHDCWEVPMSVGLIPICFEPVLNVMGV